MEMNNVMNANISYADKCGWYSAVEAELIVAKEGSKKNDSVRFSLKKFGKSGALGFSHYFTYGIPDDVEKYKELGVTEDGISDEDLNTAMDRWDNAFDKRGRKIDNGAMPFEFYGTWWTIDFGCEMQNINTEKVSSSTMVFVPCDEDTGLPLPDFVVNATRLANIMAGYVPVVKNTDEASHGDASGDTVESPEEELARLRREAAKK